MFISSILLSVIYGQLSVPIVMFILKLEITTIKIWNDSNYTVIKARVRTMLCYLLTNWFPTQLFMAL